MAMHIAVGSTHCARGRKSVGCSVAQTLNQHMAARIFEFEVYGTAAGGSNPPPPPEPSDTISISNMSGSATPAQRGRWNASVTIIVVNQSGNRVSGVVVSGNWSSGGNGSCTTNSSGQCTVSKNNLKSNVSSTTFSISPLARDGYTYNASNNSVSSTTISRP